MARTAKTTRWTYKGALAEPLQVPSYLSSQEEWNEYGKALVQKTDLLMAEFGIDPTNPDADARLMMALAIRHVPGFRPKKQGGRSKRKDDDLIVIYMTRSMLRDGISARTASRLLARTGYVPGKPETIRRRYRARKMRPWIKLLERVTARIGKEQLIAIIDKTVDEMLPDAGANSNSSSGPSIAGTASP
jgi:hypothetical protein